MSSSKLDRSGAFQPVSVKSRSSVLSLSSDKVHIRKTGVEFLSPTAITAWTEMTVELRNAVDGSRVNCSGVVVACTGNKHSGYAVSMAFLSVSPQTEQKLLAMANSRLA